MTDAKNSDEVRTAAAEYARLSGYGVHHDMLGWYVIGPQEHEPRSGYSLGFDGRRHFDLCAAAWEQAARLAMRAERRRA